MRIELFCDVWEPTRWRRGFGYATGWKRSRAHVDLMKKIDKFIKAGYTINYIEAEKHPYTRARVVITDGPETREHKAGSASARANPYVDDTMGTKRVRKDNVRSDGTRKEAAVDVGRQRKRKPSAS